MELDGHVQGSHVCSGSLRSDMLILLLFFCLTLQGDMHEAWVLILGRKVAGEIIDNFLEERHMAHRCCSHVAACEWSVIGMLCRGSSVY